MMSLNVDGTFTTVQILPSTTDNPRALNEQGREEVSNIQGGKPAKKMQRLKRKLCQQSKTSLNIG